MAHPIYRDALSAWRGLIQIGGLELDGRDEDLGGQLKELIDPRAPDLDTALADGPIDIFIQALFQVIQPFAMMFRDILDFFTKAGERDGQVQWRISVDDETIDLRNFEEFLERWKDITCLVNVPAIDSNSAWIPHNVLKKSGTPDSQLENYSRLRRTSTGFSDVDHWLAEYDDGRYTQFPPSLHPYHLGPGLVDAASISIAALDVLKTQRLNTREMLSNLLTCCRRTTTDDAFHPFSIAQNETDYWLRSCVLIIAHMLVSSGREKAMFGESLARSYLRFPRRQIGADVRIADLERLLSLPAWKTRHETYGVWVATEIVKAIDDHEVAIKHRNGELKFAFAESMIAEVGSARPRVSLISERRTPLERPLGKGRESSVQPDYGLWADGRQPEQCIMVVEAKHYKRRSRRNFRDALIDYATAHFKARVVLVNYGPAG